MDNEYTLPSHSYVPVFLKLLIQNNFLEKSEKKEGKVKKTRFSFPHTHNRS